MIGELRTHGKHVGGKSGFKKLLFKPPMVLQGSKLVSTKMTVPFSPYIKYEETDIVKETMMSVSINRLHPFDLTNKKKEERLTNIKHYQRFKKKFKKLPGLNLNIFTSMIVFDLNGFSLVNFDLDQSGLSHYHIRSSGNRSWFEPVTNEKSHEDIYIPIDNHRYNIQRSGNKLTLELKKQSNRTLIFIKTKLSSMRN